MSSAITGHGIDLNWHAYCIVSILHLHLSLWQEQRFAGFHCSSLTGFVQCHQCCPYCFPAPPSSPTNDSVRPTQIELEIQEIYFKCILLVYVVNVALVVCLCFSSAYKSYFQYYYNKPYTRYGPYLIGILSGIFMTTKKNNFIRLQVCCHSYLLVLVQGINTILCRCMTSFKMSVTMAALTVYVSVSSVTVASSAGLVHLPVSHGCAGGIGLCSPWGPCPGLCPPCSLPGSPSPPVGLDCGLDSTSLWGGLWR